MATSPEARAGSILGISAPPRDSGTIVVDKPETKTTPPIHKPEKKPDWPEITPEKKRESLIKRLTGNLGVRIGLGALALGGAGYGADHYGLINIPGIHRTAENPAETVAPFDLSKLDTERQTVVIGQNARHATPEDILSTAQIPLPTIISKPKTLEELTKISFIPSINMDEAGVVKIFRNITKGTLQGNPIDLPINLHLYIKNPNTGIGLAIPEGIATDVAEIYLQTPTSNRNFDVLYEKFNLGNDKYIIVLLSSKFPDAFLATEFTKNAPIIDPKYPRNGNHFNDIILEPGLQIDNISKNNPILFKTTRAEDEINLVALYITGKGDGSLALPNPKIIDGNLTIASLH